MPVPVFDTAKAFSGNRLIIRTIASRRDKNRLFFIVVLLNNRREENTEKPVVLFSSVFTISIRIFLIME